MVHTDGNRLIFRFFHPKAREVFLVGDFNNWNKGQLRMARTDDGYWVAEMNLPPGDYKFRYLADGQWYTDYAAFGVEMGDFGFDGIVRMAEQETHCRRCEHRP